MSSQNRLSFFLLGILGLLAIGAGDGKIAPTPNYTFLVNQDAPFLLSFTNPHPVASSRNEKEKKRDIKKFRYVRLDLVLECKIAEEPDPETGANLSIQTDTFEDLQATWKKERETLSWPFSEMDPDEMPRLSLKGLTAQIEQGGALFVTEAPFYKEEVYLKK